MAGCGTIGVVAGRPVELEGLVQAVPNGVGSHWDGVGGGLWFLDGFGDPRPVVQRARCGWSFQGDGTNCGGAAGGIDGPFGGRGWSWAARGGPSQSAPEQECAAGSTKRLGTPVFSCLTPFLFIARGSKIYELFTFLACPPEVRFPIGIVAGAVGDFGSPSDGGGFGLGD